MYNSMRRAYYREAMIADVNSFLVGCATRGQSNVQERWRTARLNIFLAEEPFSDVCRDHLGPFPVSGQGNRYILVIVCRFSKLDRAIRIPRDDAETVLEAFCEGWVTSFGLSYTLMTDSGPQHTSLFFRGGSRIMRIPNLTCITYKPQTQAQVERYNRTRVAQ